MSILEKLNGKAIPVVITSVGGIIVALYLISALINTVSANINHVADSVNEHNRDTKEDRKMLNETLVNVQKALTENTQAMRDLQVLIRTSR